MHQIHDAAFTFKNIACHEMDFPSPLFCPKAPTAHVHNTVQKQSHLSFRVQSTAPLEPASKKKGYFLTSPHIQRDTPRHRCIQWTSNQSSLFGNWQIKIRQTGSDTPSAARVYIVMLKACKSKKNSFYRQLWVHSSWLIPYSPYSRCLQS